VNIAAVILAAGASRRMGTPKALLDYRGQTFASRLAGLFQPACDRVIFVLGYHAEAIRKALPPGVTAIVNPNPEAGQLSSLQCGLRAIGPVIDAVFFMPVDLPAIDGATVEALRSAFRPGVDAVVPQHQGRHGHPALIGAHLIAAFLALPPHATARDVMHAHAKATLYVDVEDSGILRDVDDPAAYAALREVRP
jgi:CTP:molybdopterin cytidylyltransferase MocA